MRFSERLSGLFYPERCIRCGGRTEGKDALTRLFCPSCAEAFKKACEAQCTSCKRRRFECECVPDALFRAGINKSYACFAYDKERRGSPTSRLIFSLKDTSERRATALASHLLAWRIASSGLADAKEGEREEDIVVTYVPRGRKNIRLYGEDHMRQASKSAAEMLHLGFSDVFENSSRGEQKGRNAAARGIAAAETFSLCRNADLAGKRLIITDDIITSGASLSVCASLALGAGAREVSVFALAKTEKRRRSAKERA